MVILSLLKPTAANKEGKLIVVDTSLFRVNPGFAVGASIIGIVLVFVYATWW